MSDKLPFEDSFKNKLSDLPAGNMDASWQKMKQLLDEEHKPFGWLNVYTVCIGLIIAGFSIWIMVPGNHHENIVQKKSTPTSKKSTAANETHKKIADSISSALNENKISTTSAYKSRINAQTKKEHITVGGSNKKINIKNFYAQSFLHSNQANKLKKGANNASAEKVQNNNAIVSTNSDNLQNEIGIKEEPANNGFQTEAVDSFLLAKEKYDSTKMQFDVEGNLKPSANVDTLSAKKKISISLKQKRFVVETGIQLKQQIPIIGQKITTYNYSGSKGLARDYIPSVFIKVHNNGRWFLQTDFSYAAPHLTREFSYSRQTTVDYSLSTVSVTTANLQKTYYNDLTLIYNYYLQPHWSAGAGVMFSKFRGAVAEQEVTLKDIKGNVYSTTKKMIPFKNFTDSFLYKKQAGLLIQTGYSFNRWSFLLRYKIGIQPYITYTLPNGLLEDKYNSSLELNIGYRFIRKQFQHSVSK